MPSLMKKMCLVGDPAVGKTSLVKRFVLDDFDDKYIVTMGSKVTKKQVSIDYKPAGEPTQLTMMIWDVMGQRDFAHTHETTYSGATGALVVCDITRRETYESIDSWISGLDDVAGSQMPKVLVANKCDLGQHDISQDEIKELAGRHKIPYIITSAKTGEHVEEAFNWLGMAVVREHNEGKKNEEASKE